MDNSFCGLDFKLNLKWLQTFIFDGWSEVLKVLILVGRWVILYNNPTCDIIAAELFPSGCTCIMQPMKTYLRDISLIFLDLMTSKTNLICCLKISLSQKEPLRFLASVTKIKVFTYYQKFRCLWAFYYDFMKRKRSKVFKISYILVCCCCHLFSFCWNLLIGWRVGRWVWAF